MSDCPNCDPREGPCKKHDHVEQMRLTTIRQCARIARKHAGTTSFVIERDIKALATKGQHRGGA